MSDPVQEYLDRILTPQFTGLGLSPSSEAFQQVKEDIQIRISSILSCWADVKMRRTLLLIGEEEGAFYEPHTAPLDIRALTVAAIRNSFLEDLRSTHPAVLRLQGQTPPLQDKDVRRITQTAIKYWQAIPLQQSHCFWSPRWVNPFEFLAEDYPHAWHALSHLANTQQQTISVKPLHARRPTLPQVKGQRDQQKKSVVVLSGIDPQFDKTLLGQLQQIQNGSRPFFFCDSWKMLTRNPEKLYQVIDFVLAHGAAFVTFNYLLTPTMGSSRKHFLQPAHTADQVQKKLSQMEHLDPAHRSYLEQIRVASGL